MTSSTYVHLFLNQDSLQQRTFYKLINSNFAHFLYKIKITTMKLRTKLWIVSQGMLIITACIIQFTFYREIQVGPILGTPTRAYWDIIQNIEPEIPLHFIKEKINVELYDAREKMSSDQVLERNLVAHRRAVRQEDGLRMALGGGIIVNIIYFFVFHILYFYFRKIVRVRK